MIPAIPEAFSSINKTAGLKSVLCVDFLSLYSLTVKTEKLGQQNLVFASVTPMYQGSNTKGAGSVTIMLLFDNDSRKMQHRAQLDRLGMMQFVVCVSVQLNVLAHKR